MFLLCSSPSDIAKDNFALDEALEDWIIKLSLMMLHSTWHITIRGRGAVFHLHLLAKSHDDYSISSVWTYDLWDRMMSPTKTE